MFMLLFSLTPHLLIEQNHLPNEYKYYLVNNVDLLQKPCWCPKYRILLKKKFLVYNACQTFIFSSKQFCWSLGANLRLFRMLKRTVVWFLISVTSATWIFKLHRVDFFLKIFIFKKTRFTIFIYLDVFINLNILLFEARRYFSNTMIVRN